jgi:uncharacterized repeat protein (TIGR03803 family)
MRLYRSILASMLLASATLATAFAQVETVLHNFPPQAPNGAQPIKALIQDAQGNTYGATESGGRFGYGVIYRVTPAGAIKVLHSFTGGADGGGSPLQG